MSESWTPNQMLVLEWDATPRYERIPPTQLLLADKIKVHDRTITRWRKMDGWQEAVNDIARRRLRTRLPAVYGALARAAEKESFQHIKLILELVGDYKETQNVNIEGNVSLSADDIAAGLERIEQWKQSKRDKKND